MINAGEQTSVKVDCEDIDLLKERCLISGIRQAAGSELVENGGPYEPGYLVPTDPWEPSAAELKDLIATPDTPEQLRMRLVRFFPSEVRYLGHIATHLDELRDRAPHKPKHRRYLDDLQPLLKLPNGADGFMAQLYDLPPGRTTTYFDETIPVFSDTQITSKSSIRKPGLHFDNWEKWPAGERFMQSSRMLGFCLSGTRHALALRSPHATDLSRRMYPKDPLHIPNTKDLREYFKENSRERRAATVIWLRHGAGEAYESSPELWGHDASSDVLSRAAFFFFPRGTGRPFKSLLDPQSGVMTPELEAAEQRRLDYLDYYPDPGWLLEMAKGSPRYSFAEL